MSNCGELSFAQKTQIEAVSFWAINDMQHIAVLLDSAHGVGAELFPTFRKTLKGLSKDFQDIADAIEQKPIKNPQQLTTRFLKKNRELLDLLERLKFEGYNGFPVLYEAVIHFIYESEYANDVIRGVNPLPMYGQLSVLFQIKFRNMGIGSNKMQCSYGQMYFWTIIGAQHPSLLMNVTPNEAAQLPQSTKDVFLYFINKFNRIAYEMSNMYPNLSKKKLRDIYEVYETTYREFFDFLMDFKNNDMLLPYSLRRSLPKIFFGVLEHIIDEAQDALIMGEKIKRYLK